MSRIKDLVTHLLNDKTVRPKKEWDGQIFKESPKPVARSVPPPEREARPVGNRDVPTTPAHYPSLKMRIPPAELAETFTADGDCNHQWQWKSGVKTCWLCGAPAPVDRRDRSTTWQAKVYGKKR